MVVTMDFSHLDWSRQDLGRFSDVVPLSSGQLVTVRFVQVEDSEALRLYFRTLSPGSRYNRFTGASNGLSNQELDLMIHTGQQNRFAVVAEMTIGGVRTIVGEARYMFDEETGDFEFGLSVHDNHRRQRLGLTLLSNLECRAAAFGAHRIVGDTLRSNKEMQALARRAGFSFAPTPNDWRELRLVKEIHRSQHIPCAHWRGVRQELSF